MAPPLCLPRSVDAHKTMVKHLETLIKKRIGILIGPVTVIDNPKDDAQAEFRFKYFGKDGKVYHAHGSLTALWTDNNHNGEPTPIKTYVAAEVAGEGWRIFLDESDWGGPTDE
jgi:hypothetical protein